MTELDGATEAHLQLILANAAHKPPWSTAISDPEWPPLKPALGSDWLPTLQAVFTLLQGDWREQSVVLCNLDTLPHYTVSCSSFKASTKPLFLTAASLPYMLLIIPDSPATLRSQEAGLGAMAWM